MSSPSPSPHRASLNPSTALPEIQDLLAREQTLAAEAASVAATSDPVDVLCAALDEAGSEPPAPPSPPRLSANATLEERLYARTRQVLIGRMTEHTRTIRHARQAKMSDRRAEQAKRVDQKLAMGKGKRMDV